MTLLTPPSDTSWRVITGDTHRVFSKMVAYEVFRVFLCSGPDKGSGLVLDLSHLSLHPFHSFSEPEVMRECLLHTRDDAAAAAVIAETELLSDTCRCFSGQAPPQIAGYISCLVGRLPLARWQNPPVCPIGRTRRHLEEIHRESAPDDDNGSA